MTTTVVQPHPLSNSTRWTSQVALPTGGTARYNCAVAAIAGNIYIFGGYDTAAKNDLISFNPTTRIYTTATTSLTARYGSSFQAVDSTTALCFGGLLTSSTATNQMQLLTLPNTWTAKATGPSERGLCGSGILNNQFIIFGGTISGTTPTNEVWAYDISLNTWANLSTPSWTARYHPGFCTVNNKIYMFGGIGASACFSDLWSFDGTTWVQISTTFPGTDRGACILTGFENFLYVLGGQNFAGTRTAEVWAYDLNTGTWERREDLLAIKSLTGNVTIGSRAYYFGGITATTYVNEMNYLDMGRILLF